MTGFDLVSQPWIPVTRAGHTDRFGIVRVQPTGNPFLGWNPRVGGDDVGSTGARGQPQHGWAQSTYQPVFGSAGARRL